MQARRTRQALQRFIDIHQVSGLHYDREAGGTWGGLPDALHASPLALCHHELHLQMDPKCKV